MLPEGLLVLRPRATGIARVGTMKDSAAATRQRATAIPDAVAMAERRTGWQLDRVDTIILPVCWAKLHTAPAGQDATCTMCVWFEKPRQPFEKRLENK